MPLELDERRDRRQLHEQAAVALEEEARRHEETADRVAVLHGPTVAAAFRRHAAQARDRAVLERRLASEPR